MSSSSQSQSALVATFKLRGNVATSGTLEARACANGDIAVFDVSENLVQKTRHLDPNKYENNNNSVQQPISRQNFLPFLHTEQDHTSDENGSSGDEWHTAMISSCSFSLDGSVIATTSEDMKTMIWGVTHGELRGVLRSPGVLYSVCFVPGGRYLMSTCHNGTTLMFSTSSGRVKAVLQGGHGSGTFILCCTASSDGKFLATGSQDGSVCIWKCDPIIVSPTQRSSSSSQQQQPLPLGNDSHANLASSSNFNHQQGGGGGGGGATANGHPSSSSSSVPPSTEFKFSLFATLEGHTDSVFSLKFLPVPTEEDTNNSEIRHRLVSGGADGNLILWDVEEKAILKQNDLKCGTIFSVAIHPKILLDETTQGGRKLFCVGTEAGVLVFVNSETLQRFEVLKGSTQPVACVDFHPDGVLVATACEDGKIYLWNVETKQIVASLTGHKGAVYACSFSPVGEFLATAGEDQILRVWNVRGGRNLCRFKGARASCGVFAEKYEFDAKGENLVAVGADDKPLCMWTLKTGKMSFIRPDIEEVKKQQEEQERKHKEEDEAEQRKNQAKKGQDNNANQKQVKVLMNAASSNNQLDALAAAADHHHQHSDRSNSPGQANHQHQHQQQQQQLQQQQQIIHQFQKQLQLVEHERKLLMAKVHTIESDLEKKTQDHETSMKEQTEMISGLIADKQKLSKEVEDANAAKVDAEQKSEEEKNKRQQLRRQARDDIYKLEDKTISLTKQVATLTEEGDEMKAYNEKSFAMWNSQLVSTEETTRGIFDHLHDVFMTQNEDYRKNDYQVTQLGMSLEAHRQIHMGTLRNLEEFESQVEEKEKEIDKTKKLWKAADDKAKKEFDEVVAKRNQEYDKLEAYFRLTMEKWILHVIFIEELTRSQLAETQERLFEDLFNQVFSPISNHNRKLFRSELALQQQLAEQQALYKTTKEELEATENSLTFSQRTVQQLRDLEAKMNIDMRQLAATAESQQQLRQADVGKMSALEEQAAESAKEKSRWEKIRKELDEKLAKSHKERSDDVAALNEEKMKLRQESEAQKAEWLSHEQELKNQIALKQIDIDNERKNVETVESKNRSLQQDVTRAEKEKTEADEKLAQAMSFGLVLKQKLDNEKEEQQKLEKLLSEERQRSAELQQQVHSTNVACNSRIEEQQKNHNSALNAEIDKQRGLMAKADNATKDQLMMKDDLERARSEKQRIEQTAWQLQSEKTALEEKLQNVQKKEISLAEQLKQEADKRQQAESKLDIERKQATVDAEKSKTSFVATEKQAQEAESARSAAEKKLADAISHGAIISRSLTASNEQNKKLEDEIRELDEHNKNLEKEKTALDEKLAQAMSYGLVLKEKLDADLDKQRKQNEQEKIDHEKSEQTQNTKLKQLENDLADAIAKFEQMKKEKETTELQLSEARKHGAKIVASWKDEAEKRKTAEASLSESQAIVKKQQESSKTETDQKLESLLKEKHQTEETLRTEHGKREKSLSDQITQIEVANKKLEERIREMEIQQDSKTASSEKAINDIQEAKRSLEQQLEELEKKNSISELQLKEARLHGGKLVETVKKEMEKREATEKQKADVEAKLQQASVYGSKVVQLQRDESAKRKEAEERIRVLEEQLAATK